MSQFWYTSLFSRLLAHEALTLGGSRQPEQPVTLVCIACPSIFQQLYAHRSATTRVWLLEYDARFARYEPFFVHYDLHQPLHNLPAQLVHAADCLIVDPPYLNIDTLSLARVYGFSQAQSRLQQFTKDSDSFIQARRTELVWTISQLRGEIREHRRALGQIPSSSVLDQHQQAEEVIP